MNFVLLRLATIVSALVRAETITLYGFQATGLPMNAVSLSAAGVGADGATTYVEEIFQTAVVYGVSPSTVTMPVQTLHATLVADASVYRYAQLPTTRADGAVAFGVLETCTLDGKGRGMCVAEGWADGGATATTTFSGAVAPFYTLTTNPTKTPTRNGAAITHMRGMAACVIPALLGYLL